jgi:lipopolysaccharide/colanic/teichoic acid biosynthesis glycosyltransferase
MHTTESSDFKDLFVNTFNPDLPPGLAPGFLTVESGKNEREGRTEKHANGWDSQWVQPVGRSRHPLTNAGELSLVLFVFLMTLPLVILAYLIVKLTSRGAGIYSQNRVGRNGKVFLIYKLRTMYENCERWSGPKWAEPSDPRVTPFGRFLRSSHLDELPQLWNVLRGDMTLVGPRPERPEIVAKLEAEIPRYRERELIRPGVTGLAQIQLPPDTDIESVRRKLAYDLYYLREASLSLDLKIMMATALKVAGVPCLCYCRWLRIPRVVQSDRNYPNEADKTSSPTQVQPEAV